MTNHELALNEFRDASAAVRLTFAALSEAREVQIIANRAHADCKQAHVEAQSRLDAADAALLSARADAPAPADIDTTRMPSPFGQPVDNARLPTFGVPFAQMNANGSAE